MTWTRRDFLTTAAAGGATLTVPGLVSYAAAQLGAPGVKQRILFLGGTGFLGPHFVEMAIERGHEVTLLNRGSRDELFPDVELIRANRIVDVEPGLGPLEAEVAKGRTWDTVIDTASVHRWVENSARILKDAAKQYVFISSLSVYASTAEARDEEDEIAVMPDAVAQGIDRLPYDMNYYGAVKGRCEAAAERFFPGSALSLRPGLIVGPRDFTHRFTYWPLRVREGGEVLAPGAPEHPVMFIDVRDLAAFLMRCVEKRSSGVFNVNGPVDGGLTMGSFLETCREVTGSEARLTWVDADFLAERGVSPWAQMPVWIPPVGEYAGFHRTSVARARAAGLESRSLASTVRDTLAWFDGWVPEVRERRGWEYEPGVSAPGVSRQQEAEILAAWAGRGG